LSASKVIEIARAEVGYLEKKSNSQLYDKTANAGSNNYTKYGEWYGMNAQPWCDMFVSWCAYQAGELDAVGKYAYVPSHQNFFANQGRYYSRGSITPQAGDVVIFRNESHIGFVEYVSGGYVHTIEGNTSGGSTLVANGGGVFQKSYPLSSSYIQGYGRPAYSSKDNSINYDNAVTVNYRGTIHANGGLNCRTSPVSGTVIKTYANGSVITITKELDGWGYTGEGWVSLQYVTKIVDSQPEPDPVPEQPTITEDDEDMTLDRFKELMNEYRTELRDNDCGEWSKEARDWAISTGLIEGGDPMPDGTPNYMYEDLATREQLIVILYRFAKSMGMA